MSRTVITILVMSAMLLGCSEGPVGPQGEKGDTGEQGESATIFWEHTIVSSEISYDDELDNYLITIYDERFKYGYTYDVWQKEYNYMMQVDGIFNNNTYHNLVFIGNGFLKLTSSSDRTGDILLIFRTTASSDET